MQSRFFHLTSIEMPWSLGAAARSDGLRLKDAAVHGLDPCCPSPPARASRLHRTQRPSRRPAPRDGDRPREATTSPVSLFKVRLVVLDEMWRSRPTLPRTAPALPPSFDRLAKLPVPLPF
ncbi:hypothetical protein JDV02_008300 [Purpureocillium takamizusanense]|uniref:Uncharacterized protein n=1 Tax=Purpureocillium takamizusanense TaxID=2060973 RepID=A0A9Q8QPH3_9HYPO|nr:uncharacterized protein JDV02_008300 [Purpureocillium takamizusanense]UNI22409.1 hypothetical protein JDV02_008300 [Purpureocillium takamizusanense]